ncbi:hypothetical protein ACE939_01985 [Aquimarina sp. W85]|uniref:hypothetical protein n=1 Tax=Aquimarina rhodophyticola TaxID=3342246 RepID=UPI00366BB268
MKLLYKRRLLRNNLIISSFFTFLSLLGFIVKTSTLFSSYLLLIGLLYGVVYAVMKVKGYASIKNGILTKNTIEFKQLNISKIRKVVYHKDYYRIATIDKNITLYKDAIHSNSLLVLQDFLKQLQLRPTENVLQKVS